MKPTLISRTPRIGLLTAGMMFLGTAFLCSTVQGQSGHQVMVTDEGDGPQMSHFSLPDFGDLQMPDFQKRDVPLFNSRLALSPEQTSMVERAIAAYLDAFEALRKEKLASVMPQGMVFAMGGSGHAMPNDAQEGGLVAPAIEVGEGELPDLEEMGGDFDFGDMPSGTAVGLTVSIGGPTDDGGGAGPAPEVGVSIQSPDGQEISPELRKKLEEQAAAIAKQIQEQMAKQQADGGGNGPTFFGGPMGDPQDMKKHQEDMLKAADEFRKAKAALRLGFVNDVQTKLAEPQIERWPSLDRALNRERRLPKGRLSGERTDLIKVFDGLKPLDADRQLVAEEFLGYELALDNALRQRDEYLLDSSTLLDKAMEEHKQDKAISVLAREAALRTAIRSINEQFAQAIASKLPLESSAPFQSAASKASYPDIYKQTRGLRTFAAARKIDGLDEKTLASIAELEAVYTVELQQVNDQIRQAVNKYQPLEPQTNIARMMDAPAFVENPDDLMELVQGKNPIRDAFAKRTELDNRYRSSIAGLLTPEQAETLPKAVTPKQARQPVIIRQGMPSP